MENTGETAGGNTRWKRIHTLFHRAAELPETERQAFLDAEHGSDAEEKAEVFAMLRVDSDGDPFLDGGLSRIASRIVGPEDAIEIREIGPYRLVEFLGEGGMGVVWRAERVDTGGVVAIKLLLGARFSPARRERFTREIKTLAKLKHAYIARLYDAGTLEDGTPWFAMEYVQGERLVDFCQKGQLPVAERLGLFHKVCEAVQYAHGQEIIHRDLKPSNILVDKDGMPRLLDFGIARQLQGADDPDEQTRPGLRFYSPHYAAPEWVRDGMVGFYTDVYSMGVVLYEMLTEQLPFQRTGDDDRPNHAEEHPQRPSIAARSPAMGASLGKAAWADLDVLCLKALQRDPTQRYQSVEALMRDLNHYLQNEPLEARPDSVRYRMSKFIKRNRRPVLATSLASALVLGMVVFFTIRLARARDAALAEAARTQRIQDFMVKMLGGSESNAAPSADLRVVTLLDQGATDAHDLDADPETQAELYKTLARMENMLGEYPKASGLMTLALKKEIEVHGPRDIAVADLLVMQGVTFADSNDFARAEQTVRQGLALTKQLRPADDAEVYYAEAYLGIVLCDEGKYQEAIAVLTPVSAWKPSTELAKQSKAEALTNLGIANYSTGNYPAAEVFDRQALDVDKEVYGLSHPRVAEALVNIGQSLAARQRYADAAGHYRQAVAILSGWYGVGHPDTATVMSILARTLLSEDKDDEAYPLLQNALQVQDRAYGGKDKQIALTLDSLGRVEMKRGKFPAAEADFRRALEMDRSLLGEHNYQPAVIEADLADALTKEGHAAQAEPMAHNSVAVLEQAFPAGDPHTARAQIVWGHCLLVLHRDKEAQIQLEAALQNLTAQPAPNAAELEQLRHYIALASQEAGATNHAPFFQTQLEKP